MTIGHWAGWLLAVASLGQEAAPKHKEAPANDPYRSPQSTVRALAGFLELSREEPKQIEGAIECLDLSGLPNGRQQGGILASRLDAILRARDIAPSLLPDETDLAEFCLPDAQGHKIVLIKCPDGRFRFDKETVTRINEMWMQAQQLAHDRNRELAALNVAPEFSTPRATYRSFLTAMHRYDLDRAVRCFDLRDVPTVCRAAVGQQLAKRLKQIIDRQRVVSLTDIPNTNYADPFVWLSQPEGVIELARQYDGDRKGEWLFSTATVATIDPLFDASEVRPYDAVLASLPVLHVQPDPFLAPELWFRSKLPAFWRAHLVALKELNLEIYQVPAFLVGLVLAWLGGWLVGRCAQFLVGAFLRWRGIDLPASAVRKRMQPTGVLVGVLLVRLVVLGLCLDTPALIGCLSFINPTIWLVFAWAAYRAIDLVGDVIEVGLVRANRRAEVALMVWPVASLVTKLVILVAVLFRLMSIFNWDLSAVLTGLGIGGLAFALGAQDSLKNLFGSITLIADRPFVVGEKVKIGGTEEGVVEVVGLRSTRIRGADDTLITVPNSNLTTMLIANPGRRRSRLFKTTLTVAHDTPLDRIIPFRDGVRALLVEHADTRKHDVQVAVKDIGPNGVDLQVKATLEVTSGEREDSAREALVLSILALAESLGVQLARSTPVVLVQGDGMSLVTGAAGPA
jgi:MscS family membrane protein